MNPELTQALCDIIDTQNRMIQQLIDLLGQYQSVEDYEKEMKQRQQEYAAAIGTKEGR
jgi:mannitol/fructose-specific phosphotransferase system IIA component (Ntr-type)